MVEVELSRRTLIGAGITLSALLMSGCGSGAAESANQASSDPAPVASGASLTEMTVYRDPNCGCCEAWAAQARQAGFEAKVVNDNDMSAVKQRLGVPEALGSCHTAVVAGYAIEGHVPFEDIRRVLLEKPTGVSGLAVPGMPAGSPGMEVPSGMKQPYEVIAFGQGLQSVYARHT